MRSCLRRVRAHNDLIAGDAGLSNVTGLVCSVCCCAASDGAGTAARRDRSDAMMVAYPAEDGTLTHVDKRRLVALLQACREAKKLSSDMKTRIIQARKATAKPVAAGKFHVRVFYCEKCNQRLPVTYPASTSTTVNDAIRFLRL